MKKHALKLWLGLTVLGVVALWSLSWWYTSTQIKSEDTHALSDQAARGVFGDQFGGVNALFTGLAFTGVIISLLIQQKEIRKQAETLQKQQFESGFFQLMALHTKLVDQLHWGGLSGRQVFERLLETMRFNSQHLNIFYLVRKLERAEIGRVGAQGLDQALRDKLADDAIHVDAAIAAHGIGVVTPYLDTDHKQHRRYITDAYMAAHRSSSDALSHYFRTLFHILRHVDESKLIDELEKERYARLVAAQLSGLELVALFYNSLVEPAELGGQKVEFGYPNMFRLVKHYDLIKNLNADMLFHPIHMEIFKSMSTKAAK